jgi:hypothetical protein
MALLLAAFDSMAPYPMPSSARTSETGIRMRSESPRRCEYDLSRGIPAGRRPDLSSAYPSR